MVSSEEDDKARVQRERKREKEHRSAMARKRVWNASREIREEGGIEAAGEIAAAGGSAGRFGPAKGPHIRIWSVKEHKS